MRVAEAPNSDLRAKSRLEHTNLQNSTQKGQATSIALTCNAIGASYTGNLYSGTIKGRFEQRGYAFPLDLTPDIPVEER